MLSARLCLAAAGAAAAAGALVAYRPTVNGLVQRNAAGIEGAIARAAYHVTVCVAAPPACAPAYDSGPVASRAQSLDLAAVGLVLASSTKYVWTVSVTSVLDNATAAPVSASFVTGVLSNSTVDWSAAVWLQPPPSHNRVRYAFVPGPVVYQAVLSIAHSGYLAVYLNGVSVAGDEWRCRTQADVAWCQTTREVDATLFRAGTNVLSFDASAAPSGLVNWFKVKLRIWEPGGTVVISTAEPTAFAWRAGVASWRAMGQQGMNGISTQWLQAYEDGQAGWRSDGAFNEKASTGDWAACVPVLTSGGDCAASVPESETATITCGAGGTVTNITFASFGTPQGTCGGFQRGACDAPASLAVVTAACLGRANCSLLSSVGTFGPDPCLDTPKQLSIQAVCSGPPPPPTPPFDFPVRSNPLGTRVVGVYVPQRVSAPVPGTFVLSLAQNIAGWCAVHLPQLPPAAADVVNGTELTLLFGERLYANGTVFQMYGYQFQFWQNITLSLSGASPALFNFSLLQYVFQHVELRGWDAAVMGGAPTAGLLECYQVASDVPPRGTFVSSDAMLNAVSEMHRMTIVNSNQDQPLSDPERDNINWLGDAHLASESSLAFLDSGPLLTRVLDVITDVETHCERKGPYPGDLYILPYIVPTTGALDAQPCVNWFGTQPGLEWSVAYHIFVDLVSRHYNDTRPIAAHYDGMARLVNAMAPFLTPAGLMDKAIFGDWANVHIAMTPDVCVCGLFVEDQHYINSTRACACQGTTTPNQMGGGWSAAFYHVYALDAMYRFATTLGRDADAAVWFDRAAVARGAFASEFVRANASQPGGFYVGGAAECEHCMGAAAMALQLATYAGGAVLDPVQTVAVCAHLLAELRAKGGHLDTGVLSTKFMLPALAHSCGAWDAAFELATQPTQPGWGGWLGLGLTTACEQWWETGTPAVTGGALNHPMFASAASFFFEGFGGVDAAAVMAADDAGAPLAVEPVIPAGLAAAAASVDTARGLLACSWAQGAGAGSLPLALNVTVPPGVAADVLLPFPRVAGGALPPALTLTEGGRTVWAGGAFVPGAAPGVGGVAAVHAEWPRTWPALRVRVASGTYAFVAGVSAK